MTGTTYIPHKPDLWTGADAIVARMLAHDLRDIFLFPGGTIAPVLEAAKRNHVRLVCPRHEQGAGYMALAQARIHRRPAVVMATSGPGATNLVTPVADAYFDSLPLLVLTGQVGTGDLRRAQALRQRGFQECDTVGIFRPITKATLQPRDANQLGDLFDQAYALAAAGRPGPVLIDLPMDVQRAVIQRISLAPPTPTPSPYPAAGEGDDHANVDTFALAVRRATRPLLVVGAGVLQGDAVGELRALSTEQQIPVSCSLAGLGAIASDDRLSLGFHGHTGFQAAGLAIQHADVVVVVGSRLDVRQTGTETAQFAPNATILRIEIDETEIQHARVRVDHTWRMPVKQALQALLAALNGAPPPDRSAWLAQIDAWRRAHQMSVDSPSTQLRPQTVIDAVSRHTRHEELSVVTGVGSHQQWTARHFAVDFPRRAWFSSCGHGTMGFDLPTTNGVAYCRPGHRVICFVGDGSFLMNVQELAFTAELGGPILIVVLDNQRLGIVSQFQKLNWGDDPTCGVRPNPDFASIARAFGVEAFTVANQAELDAMLPRALASTKPCLLHVRISTDEEVSPMLLAGQTLDRMWAMPPSDAS